MSRLHGGVLTPAIACGEETAPARLCDGERMCVARILRHIGADDDVDSFDPTVMEDLGMAHGCCYLQLRKGGAVEVNE